MKINKFPRDIAISNCKFQIRNRMERNTTNTNYNMHQLGFLCVFLRQHNNTHSHTHTHTHSHTYTHIVTAIEKKQNLKVIIQILNVSHSLTLNHFYIDVFSVSV